MLPQIPPKDILGVGWSTAPAVKDSQPEQDAIIRRFNIVSLMAQAIGSKLPSWSNL